jgi:nucleotide-binding universal stress UspA family protein
MAFKHVLVPTDFSAGQALRYAFEEAALHHARVTLLHVLPARAETEVYYMTGSPPPLETGLDPAVAGGRLDTTAPTIVRHDPGAEALARLRDLVPAAFRDACDVQVVTGQAADSIVRVARERDADLIVMGTRGRTGLKHAVLGSVAEKVVRLAPCPVLTVR